MRFLVDECTGPAVARWLRDQSHEVFSVYENARGMSDDEVLAEANSGRWILITNDKDFGEMVFRERNPITESSFFGSKTSKRRRRSRPCGDCLHHMPTSCRKHSWSSRKGKFVSPQDQTVSRIRR